MNICTLLSDLHKDNCFCAKELPNVQENILEALQIVINKIPKGKSYLLNINN
jgi:hypothetical protein